MRGQTTRVLVHVLTRKWLFRSSGCDWDKAIITTVSSISHAYILYITGREKITWCIKATLRQKCNLYLSLFIMACLLKVFWRKLSYLQQAQTIIKVWDWCIFGINISFNFNACLRITSFLEQHLQEHTQGHRHEKQNIAPQNSRLQTKLRRNEEI